MQTMENQNKLSQFVHSLWSFRPGLAALVVMFMGVMMMLQATPILTHDPNTTNKLIVLLSGFGITIFGLKWWCDDVEKR